MRRSGLLGLAIVATVLFVVATPTTVCSAPVSSGSVTFDNSDTPWLYFLANLDFAVYAPGDPGNPVDAGSYPAVNTDYTYIYTLHNTPSSAVPLDGLDLELLTGVVVTSAGSIDDGDPATPAPDGPPIISGFVSWDFFGGGTFPLTPGKSSEQFFITSPGGPTDVVITCIFDGTSEDMNGLSAGPMAPPAYGGVCGNIRASCPGVDPTPAAGITVDLYNIEGDMVGTVDTDADGNFCFTDLEPGEYLVSIVVPLSYEVDPEEVWVTVLEGDPITQNFTLVCKDIEAAPRTIGFWKHQVCSALSGRGRQHYTTEEMCAFLDLIENRFNNNAMNPVAIYTPPASGLCLDKLEVAKDILKLGNKAPMEWRAKEQLLALLFNVASEKISLAEIISEDGANVSQAITFCDNLIDDPYGDHELAKTIADEINNGRIVPAGWIPLDTEIIFYQRRLIEMANVLPTIFTNSTKITFMLGGESYVPVDLKVFDVTGRLVRTVANRDFGPGLNSVSWDGRNDHGARVATGVYFYRIFTPVDDTSGKMILRR